MSSIEAEEATPCGGDRTALKRPATSGDASRAEELDVPALLDAHFISIVRGYEELYMSEHPLYTDRHRRRAVWEEIGTIVNQPAGDCKKRWSRIRDNYFRSVKRAKRPPAHDKLLSFLNPTFEATTTALDSDSSDGDNILSEEKHGFDVSDSSSNDDIQAVEVASAPGQQQLEHDDTVDFFVELGESVKDFPEGVRINVKREAFKIVTDAEEMLFHQKIKADLKMNMSVEQE